MSMALSLAEQGGELPCVGQGVVAAAVVEQHVRGFGWLARPRVLGAHPVSTCCGLPVENPGLQVDNSW